MKTIIITSMFFAAALMLLPAVPVASGIRTSDDLRDVRNVDQTRYDLMAERTFEGTIASTGHVIDGFMYFPMKTSDKTMEVQLGPKGFVESVGIKLKAGAVVTVVGMPVMLEEREVVLAREVRSMAMVLIVRDRNGEPMWDVNRPVQMDPDFTESTVCD
jgi:hypothetical protein